MNNPNSRYVVRGIVSDANNHPLEDLLVRAYDRDLRSESLLGECPTDARGTYRIVYTNEQFAARE